MSHHPKLWKESASIIAIAKNGLNKIHHKNTSDYTVLLQQRSKQSGFLPNTTVFPGGVSEECDSSQQWFEHFRHFGMRKDFFSNFYSNKTLSPPLLRGEDVIKRHVSLRITAIRETFEELGILICKQKHEDPLTRNKCASFIADYDIKEWQNRIQKDPSQFINLCQHLSCYPDICSLFLWSNWLTPIGYESQRFDTLFFLVGFDSVPAVNSDQREVTKVWWASPEEVMKSFNNKEITLPPPQYYEMSKLFHQKDANKLLNFASERSSLGCEQIYPILINPPDEKRYVAIFPGDELYPEKPDYEKQTKIDIGNKTVDESLESAQIAHRMEIHGLHKILHQLKNYTPMQCQVSPINGRIPNIAEFRK